MWIFSTVQEPPFSSPPTPVLSSRHFKLSALTIAFLKFGAAEESLSALVSALGSVIFLVLFVLFMKSSQMPASSYWWVEGTWSSVSCFLIDWARQRPSDIEADQ